MARCEVQSYGQPMSARQFLTRRLDALVAVALAALYSLEIAWESGFAGDRLQSFVVALAFCAALAFRRRWPVLPMSMGVFVIEYSNLAPIKALAETGAFLVGLILSIYSIGRYARGRQAVVGVLLVAAAVALAAIEPGNPFSFSDLAFFVVFSAGSWGAGRFVRHRRERERDLLGRTAQLEVERDTRAREAVAEERTRIARELHDVVSHAISLIVVQARGGRRLLDEDPGETRRALDVIERAGSEALQEMRRLLGLLRQDDTGISLAPQPSLRRIDQLVEAIRSSGLPVEVAIEGDPVDLPPGVDVSAYRIVQEALTNALKHAGPARARVTVTYASDAVDLAIVDDGAGDAGADGNGGYGLAGMRERVAIYGGELESGIRPHGGYALRVRLPLPPDS